MFPSFISFLLLSSVVFCFLFFFSSEASSNPHLPASSHVIDARARCRAERHHAVKERNSCLPREDSTCQKSLWPLGTLRCFCYFAFVFLFRSLLSSHPLSPSFSLSLSVLGFDVRVSSSFGIFPPLVLPSSRSSFNGWEDASMIHHAV